MQASQVLHFYIFIIATWGNQPLFIILTINFVKTCFPVFTLTFFFSITKKKTLSYMPCSQSTCVSSNFSFMDGLLNVFWVFPSSNVVIDPLEVFLVLEEQIDQGFGVVWLHLSVWSLSELLTESLERSSLQAKFSLSFLSFFSLHIQMLYCLFRNNPSHFLCLDSPNIPETLTVLSM